MDTTTQTLTLATGGASLTPAGVAAVRRQSFSPSAAQAQSGCHVSFAYSKIVPTEADPMSPAGMGTLIHATFERLMALPKRGRTKVKAREILTALAQAEDSSPERLVRAWEMVAALWQCEKPETVAVHATEQKISSTVAGVPFFGVIDRLDKVEGGLVIVDYKTGKKPTTRFGDKHGDQIRTYALALQALTPDVRIVGAKLYYVGESVDPTERVVEVSLAAAELDRVASEFSAAWKAHNADMTTAELSYTSGPLCRWCPLVNMCPNAAAHSMTKAERAPEVPTTLELAEHGITVAQRECEATAPAVTLTQASADIFSMADFETEPATETENKSMTETEPRAPRVFAEDKPWVVTTQVPNAGAYYAASAFGLAGFVAKKAAEHYGRALTEEDFAQVRKIARAINDRLNRLQRVISVSESPNAGIATRLRGAFYSASEYLALPFENDIAAYLPVMTAQVVGICRIAYDLCE